MAGVMQGGPEGSLGMPTTRHWQQLPCWRATLRGWATPSHVDGWSANSGQFGIHWHLHSGGCSRSHGRHLLAGDKEQVPSVAGHTGDSAKRQAPLPSPPGSEGESPSKSTAWGDTSKWEVPPQPGMRRHPTGGSWQREPWAPPSLDPDLEYFLGRCMP